MIVSTRGDLVLIAGYFPNASAGLVRLPFKRQFARDLSAVVAAAFNILSKKGLRRYVALEFTSYAIWAGTLPLFIFLPGLIRQFRVAAPPATFAVIYLGIFPAAIAYVLWNYALARMPASLLSSFLYLAPVIAIFIAWVWLGEIPALLTVLGGAIAILGVILVQTKGHRAT